MGHRFSPLGQPAPQPNWRQTPNFFRPTTRIPPFRARPLPTEPSPEGRKLMPARPRPATVSPGAACRPLRREARHHELLRSCLKAAVWPELVPPGTLRGGSHQGIRDRFRVFMVWAGSLAFALKRFFSWLVQFQLSAPACGPVDITQQEV